MNALTRPASSTIKWATVAGSGMTGFWGLVETFTSIEPSSMVVGGTVAFAAGLVGKLVPEKRYKMTER